MSQQADVTEKLPLNNGELWGQWDHEVIIIPGGPRKLSKSYRKQKDMVKAGSVVTQSSQIKESGLGDHNPHGHVLTERPKIQSQSSIITSSIT